LLVLRGAQVARGFDALHQAAAAGYTDLAEYILDIRPELDVDEPDEKGLTPFYYAFANRRWDSTVPLLLARGANIDAGFEVRRRPGRLTTTPLGEACRLGRFEDALKLIDLGADVALGVLQEIPLPRLPRDDGNSDVHRARPPAEISKTRIPLLHVCSMDFSSDKNLYSWSTSVWEPSSLQTFSRPMLIARLVAAGLSPDLKRDPGTGHPETPLSIAVCHLNVPAVRALLDAGADVNTRGPHARSPLMLATTLSACHHCQWRYGDEYWGGCHLLHCSQYYAKPPEAPDRWRIARLLLDAGARVNDQDPEGNTALHLLFLPGNETQSPWSRIADDGARRQFLRLLLARGADPCSRNGSGKSVLRLLVEYAETEALETISAQCRIDLADCLPVDEIIAIFAAMPGRESRWDPPSDRAGSADVGGFVDERAPCRLPDALLSMDSSGGVAANLPSICRSLLDSKRLGPAADVIEILCSRGLDKGLFSLETKQALLPFALQLERWQMAYQLLDELPHVRDINAPVAGNLTPLSLVTLSATFHRTGSPGVDIQLVEAGANVHLPLASGLTHLCDARADVGVVTPLKQALVYPSAFNIDWMLHRQPIRGNPQAAAARYLHFVVASTWRKQLPEWARPPDVTWYVREETIRTLFAAGADTAQLDDESNTPLSALLHELDEDTHRLRHVCHWFKPLSRGVDINHRNKKGLSIADYLDGILKVPRAAKILNLYLELVTLESGKRDIKWLK
jgi:ankyrin repeat protein